MPTATSSSLNLSPGAYGHQPFPSDVSYLPPGPTLDSYGHGDDFTYDPFSPGMAGSNAADQRAPPLQHDPSFYGPDDGVARSSRSAGKLPQAIPMPEGEEYYWYSDDDASMAESDDDELYPASELVHLESNDLGIIVARRLAGPPDVFGTHMRTYSIFADNVLATYIPSSANSPLNDTQTASVFWYFVNVTGPSVSLYERHPFDPSPMFQGETVSKSRNPIWTCTFGSGSPPPVANGTRLGVVANPIAVDTFPIIALNHPALLQAMLALASLQMAKLQGVPATASMKHYHLSIRRIAKNYQSAGRRMQPATLAATLLLGFYEVWNSDHDKWCKHMWGARAILKEHDLGEMTRGILAIKQRRRQRLEQLREQQPYDSFTPHTVLMDDDHDGISTTLLSQLAGRPVSYDEPGRVSDPSQPWTPPRRYTERDVETYELLRDLYWWYCKMDVYQSFLGATRLLYASHRRLLFPHRGPLANPVSMNYDLWTECTPRSPIGRKDAMWVARPITCIIAMTYQEIALARTTTSYSCWAASPILHPKTWPGSSGQGKQRARPGPLDSRLWASQA